MQDSAALIITVNLWLFVGIFLCGRGGIDEKQRAWLGTKQARRAREGEQPTREHSQELSGAKFRESLGARESFFEMSASASSCSTDCVACRE